MSNIKRDFNDHVFGRTAETTGDRWVAVQQDNRTGWTSLASFTGNGAPALQALSQQGIHIVGTDHTRFIHNAVADLKSYPKGDLVVRIGRNGKHFALQDGTVFSPEGIAPFAVTIEPMTGKNDVAGSMDKWLSKVAAPLNNLALATFCLALCFVGPILGLTNRDGNFGFELVGGKGIGKTTLQRIIASVFGGIGGDGGRYHETFDTTLNALETQVAAHADLLLILDEAALFFGGSSDKKRSGQFQTLAFKLATGDEKGRYGSTRSRGTRIAYLSSSNEPLADLIGSDSVTASAAGDRLISIKLPANRPYGVFEKLPKGFESGSQLAQTLISAAGKHHGHAIRVFLQALVKDCHADEKAVRALIAKRVSRFQTAAGIDPNSGAQVRVAEAFGLVYAAGRLARDYGALPSDFKRIDGCVMAIYRHYEQTATPPRPLLERLEEVANDAATIRLEGKREALKKKVLEGAPAFLLDCRGGRELLIRPEAFVRLFHDHARLLAQRETKELLKRDGRNLASYRVLASNRDKERVYVFQLPAHQSDKDDATLLD